MNKKQIVLGMVSCLLLLSATSVMAVEPWELLKPQSPDVKEGEMYRRSDFTPRVPDFDIRPLPTPAAEPTMMPVTLALPSKGLDEGLSAGSALVGAAGGGSLYTPQQHADREINKMIRRLK